MFMSSRGGREHWRGASRDFITGHSVADAPGLMLINLIEQEVNPFISSA